VKKRPVKPKPVVVVNDTGFKRKKPTPPPKLPPKPKAAGCCSKLWFLLPLAAVLGFGICYWWFPCWFGHCEVEPPTPPPLPVDPGPVKPKPCTGKWEKHSDFGKKCQTFQETGIEGDLACPAVRHKDCAPKPKPKPKPKPPLKQVVLTNNHCKIPDHIYLDNGWVPAPGQTVRECAPGGVVDIDDPGMEGVRMVCDPLKSKNKCDLSAHKTLKGLEPSLTEIPRF